MPDNEYRAMINWYKDNTLEYYLIIRIAAKVSSKLCQQEFFP